MEPMSITYTGNTECSSTAVFAEAAAFWVEFGHCRGKMRMSEAAAVLAGLEPEPQDLIIGVANHLSSDGARRGFDGQSLRKGVPPPHVFGSTCYQRMQMQEV